MSKPMIPSDARGLVDAGGCPETATILDAMRWMSAERQSLAPILGANGALLGIVTDGDIRRGLLRGVALEDAVSDVMNTDPIVVSDEMEEHEVADLLRARRKVSAPVVDRSGRFVRMAQTNSHIIPNCVPHCTGQEQTYVAEAISGGWLAVGPFIQRLEREIAAFCGTEHAVAVSTGTAALHLALDAVGVRADDRVLTPSFTFAATANAVLYTGAQPIFFDADPVSMGVDVEQVRAFLEDECDHDGAHPIERASGATVRAIVPAHIYGHPCDVDALKALCDRYGLICVDDVAEALGARYRGRRLGAEQRISCLSFNGNKIITGGGGGMVLTNDAAAAERVRHLAAQAKADRYEFEHSAVGYNYRMPNIMAAVCLAQAETLEQRLRRKREIVDAYAADFADLDGVSIWRGADWAEHAHWMAVLQFDEARYPDAKDELRYFASARGVELRPVWKPLHGQAPYKAFRALPAPSAEALHRSALCLPCSVGLTDADQRLAAKAIREFFTLFSARRS